MTTTRTLPAAPTEEPTEADNWPGWQRAHRTPPPGLAGTCGPTRLCTAATECRRSRGGPHPDLFLAQAPVNVHDGRGIKRPWAPDRSLMARWRRECDGTLVTEVDTRAQETASLEAGGVPKYCAQNPRLVTIEGDPWLRRTENSGGRERRRGSRARLARYRRSRRCGHGH